MTILVIAEHNNIDLKPDTARIVTAAKSLSDNIHMLVVGKNCDSVVKTAQQVSGVSQVLIADADEYQAQLAENISKLIAELAIGYTHILTTASNQGKDLLPRVAALLDVSLLSDVIDVINTDTFVRPIYAGNAIETIQSLDDIKLITIRASAFDASANDGQAELVTIDKKFAALTSLISENLTISERPELGNANIIISGGRGIGSKENFALLEQLADKLGAAIGASRAAVDAGFVSNDFQVGQTGKIVAPNLYIAIGISGAIQHLAGMKDSKVIVAINKDADAPIFQIADYGLVADLFESVPELINSI